MILIKRNIIEINVYHAINRKEIEGELAWQELTNHHAIPNVTNGRYPLIKYWNGYAINPYENLDLSKKELGNEWINEGILSKVIADYILKSLPNFNDWYSIILVVEKND